MSAKAIGTIVLAFVLFVVVIMVWPFTVIHPGEKGIVIRAGKINRTIDPGFHTVTPLVESVVHMDVQTQKEQTEASAASKDLQTVRATVALNYNLVPEKVADLYARIGESYKSRVIDPAIQEAVKAATANYTAEELVTKRPQVTEDIQAALSDKLGVSDIVVTSVSIVDFDFSESFNTAIEAKVTAEQNALAAKNKLEQVKYEGEQTKVQADAQAYTTRVQSEAANNQKFIELKQLEVQKAFADKWNGQLPQNLYGSAPIPFLQLGGN